MYRQNKISRRQMLRALAVGTAGLAVAGCQAPAAAPAPPVSAPAAASEKVLFWKPPHSEREADLWKPLLERFQGENAGITVEHQVIPWGSVDEQFTLINKKAFEKVGFESELATYDELKMLAPELKKVGIAPVTHPGKNIYLWPVWQFWAYAQTSGNQAVENTIKTLVGEMKFTDPEHVAGLEILHNFARDGMFIDSVNSLEGDGAWLPFTQGKAAIYYMHSSRIAAYRAGDFPELDMSLIQPVRAVSDESIIRQLPGGTGTATGIYAKIKPEREQIALKILDLMTSDEWVKWRNEQTKDPVSCNVNVQASDDPLALKYAQECAPHQIVYLDWYWPPEVTRAFQENQQAIVAGTKDPDEAAASIQGVLDGLYKDGYQFQQ